MNEDIICIVWLGQDRDSDVEVTFKDGTTCIRRPTEQEINIILGEEKIDS